MLNRFLPVSLAWVLAFCAPAASAAAPDLGQAEALLRAGKAPQAYQMLQGAEFEMAGNESYDYLFGVAALESGHADRATLVFERVLAVNPAHAAARLDMGRAYFALGDYQRAKTEFEAVNQLNPPPAARTTIDRYLKAIEDRRKPQRVRKSGYIEVARGRDTNVPAGAAQTTLYLPIFQSTVSLGSTSGETPDDYDALGVGGEVSVNVTDRFSIFAGGDAKLRYHGTLLAYDNKSYDARTGLQWAGERNTFRLSASRNDYFLDRSHYRWVNGYTGEWRYQGNARNLFALFAQHNDIRYVTESTKSNDVNQILYGAGWTRLLNDEGTRLLALSFFSGWEQEQNSRADGNKRFFGGRAAAQWRLSRGDVDIFGSLGAMDSRYTRINPFYLDFRREFQYDSTIGAVWRFRDRWSLKPQLVWTRNDAKQELYDYTRYDLSLTLRREF